MQNLTKTFPDGKTMLLGKRPSPLEGKVVVITGKLEHFTRREAQRKLTSLGAIPERNVTQKTDLLICGEKPGIKLLRAQMLGVPVLTEQEFLSAILPTERGGKF